MMYGLDTWYTPPSKEIGKNKTLGSVGALREFTKLQRIATLVINGALCLPPTDLLNAHTSLLPVDLLLKKICFRALALLAPGGVSPGKTH